MQYFAAANLAVGRWFSRPGGRAMRFSPRTVTLLWDVHAWAGVIVSLVLAMMFFCGSLSLFHHDIEAWQDPPEARGTVASLDTALAAIDGKTLAGKSVSAAPPSDHAPRAALYLPDRAAMIIDPATGAAMAERSMVGRLFYHLHILWHEAFPAGFVIAGVIATFLLLIIATGVVIHLKDLRRQAFRFRPWLRPRYLWSDLHKVLGVWGLPFQLMIAVTAAVIMLASVIGPPLSAAAFDGDRKRWERELYGNAPAAQPSDEPATMLSFTALTEKAALVVPGMEPTYVAIDRYGRAGARATVYGDLHAGGFSPSVQVALDASTGALLSRSDRTRTPAQSTMAVVYGIHFASYGGLGLKIAYFLLGIAGWLTILSGNWIWIERRAARRGRTGNPVLARLTLGAGGGLLIAVAGALWINRLLAPSAARPSFESYGFFAIWALVTLIALALPARRRSWAVILGTAGLALVAVPVLSFLVSPAHLGNGGGVAGGSAIGVDIGALLFGSALLVAARVAWRGAAVPVPSAAASASDADEEDAP
jgi:uncharacterized iron-regulated membrane protein